MLRLGITFLLLFQVHSVFAFCWFFGPQPQSSLLGVNTGWEYRALKYDLKGLEVAGRTTNIEPGYIVKGNKKIWTAIEGKSRYFEGEVVSDFLKPLIVKTKKGDFKTTQAIANESFKNTKPGLHAPKRGQFKATRTEFRVISKPKLHLEYFELYKDMVRPEDYRFAEVVVNGKVYHGKYLGRDADYLELQVGKQIEQIDFDDSENILLKLW